MNITHPRRSKLRQATIEARDGMFVLFHSLESGWQTYDWMRSIDIDDAIEDAEQIIAETLGGRNWLLSGDWSIGTDGRFAEWENYRNLESEADHA